MPDIILTVVSGETTELSLAIPGVQGPIGQDTLPSGGTVGQIIVKQSSVDYDAAWTNSASGLTVEASTLTNATISGGTISGATIYASGATLESSTITAGTISGVVLHASGATLIAPAINGGTSSGTTFSSSIVLSPTISGTISAGSGLVIGGASDILSFYGASAVVQPSGVAIPSGGATVDEVNAAVSGVITALQSLGLLA